MKKYIQLYHQFRSLIESGAIADGEKLPSVRKAATIYGVSVTTVQNAYFELQADGYIIAGNRSGYYARFHGIEPNIIAEKEADKNRIRFDLSSGSADSAAFDLSLWKRYIRSALRQGERLLSYSEPAGERDLREALCGYIKEKRNILTSPDRIVVGGGIQPLLVTLACLLKDNIHCVSFPDNSFVQGISLLTQFGYTVHTRDKDADLIYVSPSHMTSYGDVMPIKRRLELVHYSAARGSIVIEDDYDSDFVYHKPVPSLYTLSQSDNVVYMGSFSNVLIPGIRISFMVLTEALAEAFRQNTVRFAQTASKTEQIALCNYIRDGHILSQTRKIRRIYTSKARAFFDILKEQLPECKAQLSENGLQIKLTAHFTGNADDFINAGISVFIKEYQHSTVELVLTPSALSGEELLPCAVALKEVLEQVF